MPKNQPAQLFTHDRRENKWIKIFLKGSILEKSAM